MRPNLTKKITLSTHLPRTTPAPASPKLKVLARLALPLIAAVTAVGMIAAPASANRRQDAMSWALRQRGCPYVYGGTGPCSNGFDCSGLVVAAYAKVGMALPRTTYEMLDSHALKETPSCLAASSTEEATVSSNETERLVTMLRG